MIGVCSMQLNSYTETGGMIKSYASKIEISFPRVGGANVGRKKSWVHKN